MSERKNKVIYSINSCFYLFCKVTGKVSLTKRCLRYLYFQFSTHFGVLVSLPFPLSFQHLLSWQFSLENMGGKRHSEDLKKAVIAYWQKIYPAVSYPKISETFGMAVNTIKNLVKEFKKTGRVANDTSKHRQKSTTIRQDREIVNEVRKNPRLTNRYCIHYYSTSHSMDWNT